MAGVCVPNMSVELKSVRLKSPEVDLQTGLLASPTLNWLPVSIESADLVATLQEQVPVDGREIVEWMHVAAADNAVFEGFEEEYRVCSASGGGSIASRSGDGYIPGVRVSGIRAASWRGSYVRSRRYTMVYTPRGSFRVPLGGKALFANRDILAWASLPFTYGIQYIITLLRWLDLARAPITKRVRFPSSHGRVAPNFFTISTRFPSPVRVMRIGITSDKPQKITIRGRGTKGAYHNVLFSDTFEVDKGQNEVIYYVTGFPTVGTFTVELQPRDGTKTVLDYLYVYP